ncbi:hypothetical protein [Lichenibacterium minor]|uniref:hypothetical protein n=1 Tax=Lichenibacterium minor TaxID=2316528 RepID=UPI001FE23295|nr:hypothetical protein [Lichenibacterium minor]
MALAAPATAFAQQHGGSAEDQLACTPDVYRLCASNIPDEDAITACLRQNKSQLSAGCKAVFSRPDTAAAPKKTDDDD